MSDINDLRNKMDKVTLEMINLLKTRTDIAKEIGKVKKNIGKGISDEEREGNLRGKIIDLSKEIELDESIIVVGIIAIVSIGAAIFYLKGYKK